MAAALYDERTIVHVFNSSKVSGVESLVLPALPQLGLPVRTVFLLEDRCGGGGRRGRDYAEALGLPVTEVRVRGRLDGQAVADLTRYLTAWRPAIVHAHDVKASTYTWAATRLGELEVPRFSTHHGLHGRPDRRARLYEGFYRRLVLPRFERVLAVSTPDFRELRRALGARVALHLNGVDAPLVEAQRRSERAAQVRAAWPLAGEARRPGTLLLGMVGRLSREKGHERALGALAALVTRYPALRWHLVCFGTGARAVELKAETARLGLGERVTWAGYRPRVGEELAGFDLLLSLSDAEGLPLNVVEAGWAGTPVLATAVGGVLDLLGEPPAPDLVSPRDPPEAIADATARLLGDEPLRRALGGALQARVRRHFSRAAWLVRLRELYQPYLANLSSTERAHA